MGLKDQDPNAGNSHVSECRKSLVAERDFMDFWSSKHCSHTDDSQAMTSYWCSILPLGLGGLPSSGNPCNIVYKITKTVFTEDGFDILEMYMTWERKTLNVSCNHRF